MKKNHRLLCENWDVGFPLFLFQPFLKTMLLSESLISRIFLKPNRFWFQKNDGKNIDWSQKEILGKMQPRPQSNFKKLGLFFAFFFSKKMRWGRGWGKMRKMKKKKKIINTIYVKPCFHIIKKIVRKLYCKCTLTDILYS